MVFAHRRGARLHHPRRPVPRVPAGGADPAGRAALARRRIRAPADHRDRPERLVGDGIDPAGGLVVKNGIVLLDYAHRLRDEGTPFTEALETAGRVRLRPILMTTLCTLFGLLPLALGLGAGAELQRPLALAVIGGLTLSTFVTLYLVPLAYRALSRTA